MKLKYLKKQSAFTIMELMVASFLGLMILGLFTTLMQTNRDVLGKDLNRTTLNQSLRGAIDVLGADVRVGGENLSNIFPAIELINETGTDSDILIIRRNLLDEVLPVCQEITAGTAVNDIFFSVAGNVSGCTFSGHTHDYTTWRNYRLASPGGITKAYIYNNSTRLGEFFDYVNESGIDPEYKVIKAPKVWQNTYTVGSSAVYMIEEWRYSLVGDNLQLVENQDDANPLNVSFAINNFSVEITTQDGSILTSLSKNDDWTEITDIKISLTGSESYGKENITRSASAKFFPRNILSN